MPSELPGNIFIEGDGTCGGMTESKLTSTGAFVGFIFVALALAGIAGAFNFVSLSKKTKECKLFKHGIYRQTIIDVIASIIAPILAATAFKQDQDTYTWHNFHVVAWTVLFGYRPGAIMAILQAFGREMKSPAAAAQMIADMIFPLVGSVIVLATENGSVAPVAYGVYRSPVLAGVVLLILQLVLLIFIYLAYLSDRNASDAEGRYQVFLNFCGRFYVFFLGLISLSGSTILLVIGSKMCGKLITFIDAMCQLLQAVLSAVYAAWSLQN